MYYCIYFNTVLLSVPVIFSSLHQVGRESNNQDNENTGDQAYSNDV